MAILIETKEPLGSAEYTIGSRKVEQVEAQRLVAESRKVRTVYDREMAFGPFTQKTTYDVNTGAAN